MTKAIEIALATSNNAKYEYMSELINIKDRVHLLWLKINDPNHESDSAEGNAKEKAVNSSKNIKMPVLAVDEELYLCNLENDIQPGAKMKRIVSKKPSDSEIIEYYTNVIKKMKSTKCKATIIIHYGLARNGNLIDYSNYKIFCEFRIPPSQRIIKGRPLASIHYIKRIEKYYVDMNKYERKNYNMQFSKEIKEFINKNVS